MRCTSCGAELPEGTAFCTSCGSKVVQTPSYPQQPTYDPNAGYQNPAQTAVQPNYSSYNPNPAPNQAYPAPMQQNYAPMNMNLEDTTPISPWGYIGYNFLFAIPVVGLIMMFVYAFGSNTNRNLKNYARSFLIMMLIVIVIYVVIFAIAGATLAGIANSLGQ